MNLKKKNQKNKSENYEKQTNRKLRKLNKSKIFFLYKNSEKRNNQYRKQKQIKKIWKKTQTQTNQK